MFLKYNWPGILWIIIIMVLIGTPGNYIPKVITFWNWLSPDKIIHLLIFGILTFLLIRGFQKQFSFQKLRLYSKQSALIFGIFFGLLTEVLQIFVFTGRYGSMYDFSANTLGCLLGLLFYNLINRKLQRKSGNL